MNNDNAYLINVKKMVPAIARCKLYAGFKWALPDVEHLRHLMRHVFENQDEARRKGTLASQQILTKYDLCQIGKIVKEHLM